MKFFKYIALGSMALSLGAGVSSCTGDLDVEPDDPNKQTTLTTPEEWYGYFQSLYGNLLYEGGLTPAGVDGGAGTWMRCHWNLQEITADEAIILNTWNDPGYADLKYNTWVSDNTWEFMAYQREATSIKLCSEFLSKVDGAKSAGVSEEMIEQMKAEARVLRAYCYYYMIDLFGRGPWITNEPVGAEAPVYDRKQLFEAVTAELTDVINNGALLDSKNQSYGRLSKQAAEMILAKLYLNAEVYAGEAMYDKCAQWCQEIMKDTNVLADEYKYLFCATNDRYVGKGKEIIFAIPQDANHMQTYGGTTYLTAGAYFGVVPDELKQELGAGGQEWGGLKMRPELVDRLATDPGDKRNLIYAGEFSKELLDLADNTATGSGYMCIKYKYTGEDNYYNVGGDRDRANVFCDTDYPVFRLADVYLMLAECQKRGASNVTNGVELFNKVRERAGLGQLNASDVTLDEILNERQRELYWEGHRRSDLIRFGKYTTGYTWSWKGGVPEGRDIDSHRTVFAIPYQYVGTIGQNTGY